MTYRMKRATFTMTQQQLDWLEAESEKTGLNKVEIVRRALDTYKDAQTEKEQSQYFTVQQKHDIQKIARLENITEAEVIRNALGKEIRFVENLRRRRREN